MVEWFELLLDSAPQTAHLWPNEHRETLPSTSKPQGATGTSLGKVLPRICSSIGLRRNSLLKDCRLSCRRLWDCSSLPSNPAVNGKWARFTSSSRRGYLGGPPRRHVEHCVRMMEGADVAVEFAMPPGGPSAIEVVGQRCSRWPAGIRNQRAAVWSHVS